MSSELCSTPLSLLFFLFLSSFALNLCTIYGLWVRAVALVTCAFLLQTCALACQFVGWLLQKKIACCVKKIVIVKMCTKSMKNRLPQAA